MTNSSDRTGASSNDAGFFVLVLLSTGVMIPHLVPITRAYEIDPKHGPWVLAGLTIALVGVSALICSVPGTVRWALRKAATRRRRLGLVAALPAARTRKEKLESLKQELDAAERQERDRLDAEGRKIEAEAAAAVERVKINGNGDVLVNPAPGRLTFMTTPTTGTSSGGQVTICNAAESLTFNAHGQSYTLNTKTEPVLSGTLTGVTSIVGALNALEQRLFDVDVQAKRRLDVLEAVKPSQWAPRKESVYDTDPLPTKGLKLVPLPGPGSIAGRPRKEPVWERRVFQAKDYDVRFFMGGYSNKDGSPIQTNLQGSGGCLPQACHLFWYNLAVRFDNEPSAEWLACSKISFEFATSRLMTLPLGVVKDAGIEGRDVTIMGRPVEIHALEAFYVRIETQGYNGPDFKIGMTVSLNGIMNRGVTG